MYTGKLLMFNLLQAQLSTRSQSGHGAISTSYFYSLSLVCAGDGAPVTGQEIKIYLGREGASFTLLCRGVEV